MSKNKKKKKNKRDEGDYALGFRAWRKANGLKQKEAAELLGLKKRMIQYYESGKLSEKDVVSIPKAVRLACYAITLGVGDFDFESVEPLDDETGDKIKSNEFFKQFHSLDLKN